MNRSISPVSFFINDRQLKGLDPFLEGSPHHKRNPKTDEGKPVEMAVKYYDKGYEKEAMIKVQTFILPHQDDLSKEDVEALGGMEVLKDEQGFFVYRNDRLIIYGTWFRLSSRSVNAELYKYGRIKVDIPNKLDSLWDIDIKKQNAVIPKQIVNLLRKSVMRVCSTSKEKTGRRVKLNDGENEEQIWIKTPSRNGKDVFSINHNSPFVQQCLDSFEDGERARILRMLDAISANIPFDDIYISVCNKNQETELSEDKEDSLVLLGVEQFNSIKKIRQCTDEDCFREDLMVIFLFSKAFYDSNICISEAGAAWATNQNCMNVVIDISFSDIEKPSNNALSSIKFQQIRTPDQTITVTEFFKTIIEEGLHFEYDESKLQKALNYVLKTDKYSDQKIDFPATFLPKRKFLPVPRCPKCHNIMLLTEENGRLKYVCSNVSCDECYEAVIN